VEKPIQKSPQNKTYSGKSHATSSNRRADGFFGVLVIGKILSVPCNRESWVVTQRAQSREGFTEAAALRFDYEALSVLIKLDPGMSGAVSSVLAEHDPGVVSQVHHLAPGPECEVVAVSLLPFFEIFWRLPILVFIEELFVGTYLHPIRNWRTSSIEWQ